MLRRGFAFLGVLALAGAVVLLIPGDSQAQRRGGWGGGGWGGRGWGGYGGYGGYGYSPWGYGGYYPRNYGYSGWYSPNYYYGERYNYAPDYNMGSQDYYTGNQGGFSQPYMRGQTYSYGSEMEGQAPQDPNTARITVRVPANAEIQFEGQKTQQRGSTRQFVSPPLTPGKQYTYDVKAQWTENGQDVTQERQVPVRAGGNVMVDFMGGPEGRPATRMDRRFERRYGAPPERQGNFEQQDRTGTFEQRDLQQGAPSSDQRANPTKDKTPSSDQRANPAKDKTPSSDQRTTPSKDKTPSSDQRTTPSKDKAPSSDQRTTPSKDKTPSPDQRSKDRENNSGTQKP